MANPLDLVSEVLVPIMTDQFGQVITDSLRHLLEGAEEDLRTFGLQIAEGLVHATLSGDTAWVEECKAQALVLIEINRLRVVNQNTSLVLQVLEAVIGMALRAGLAVAAQALLGQGDLGGGRSLLDQLSGFGRKGD